MPVKASKCIVRKYDPEYVRFGFIKAGSDELRVQRVECGEILSNEELKPSKLQRQRLVRFFFAMQMIMPVYYHDRQL